MFVILAPVSSLMLREFWKKRGASNMMRMNKGFTMIEILIVLVAIGLLAALMIPRFFGQEERGVVAESVVILSAIRQGEEAYKLENSAYLSLTSSSGSTEWNKLGIDDPNNAQFSYKVDLTSGSNFIATATRLHKAGATNDCAGTVTLTNGGVFAGTHLYGPTYNSANVCGSFS